MDPAGHAQLSSRLHCLETDEDFEVFFPWFRCAAAADRARFRSELNVLLGEAEFDGERPGFELDLIELRDLAAEYAGLCSQSSDMALVRPEPPAPTPRYSVHIRERDLDRVSRCESSLRALVDELLGTFLAQHPTAGGLLQRGSLKKMVNRGLWQIDLPHGFRLVYRVDEEDRSVHVTYLGPHPDSRAVDGRVDWIRRAVHARRYSGS